jgi:hypothetical protein
MIEVLDITEKEYRALPFLANSSMSTDRVGDEEVMLNAMRIGTAGHEITQGFDLSVSITDRERLNLGRCAAAIHRNKVFRYLMDNYKLIGKEVKFVNHNLKTRAMCDFYWEGGIIGELKFLNAETESAFASGKATFDYDRAAYHYLITTGATAHVIIAVSKKNHRVFVHVTELYSETWLEGKRKWLIAKEKYETQNKIP